MEEVKKTVEVVEKKTFKQRWNELKLVKFCKEHPDGMLGILGGLITLIAGVVKILVSNHEYEDYIYVTDNEGNVNKIPSKTMRTAKSDYRTTEDDNI